MALPTSYLPHLKEMSAQGLRPRGHEAQREFLPGQGCFLTLYLIKLAISGKGGQVGAYHTIPTRLREYPSMSELALLGFGGLGDNWETFPTDNLALCVLGCGKGCGFKGFQPIPCPEGAYMLCLA